MSVGAERRAAALRRLAGLVERGVPLGDALAVLDVGRAPRGVGEGARLDEVVVAAGLATPAEAALLAAGAHDPARALALLATRVDGQAELARAWRDALGGPLRKAVGFVVLAIALPLVVTALLVVPADTLETTLPAALSSFTLPPESTLDAGTPLQPLLAAAVGGLLALPTLVGAIWLALRSGPGLRTLERIGRETLLVRRLLELETTARYLDLVAVALGSGLTLPEALAHAEAGFGERIVAEELRWLTEQARQGADARQVLTGAPFLGATATLAIEQAVRRPDLPAELRELAALHREQLAREAALWAPVLGGLAELCVAIPVAAYLVAVFLGTGLGRV